MQIRTVFVTNGSAHLHMNGNNLMDLLEHIGSHGLICKCSYSLDDLVIGSNWTGPSSPSQEALQTRFKMDAEMGWMIIDDNNVELS